MNFVLKDLVDLIARLPGLGPRSSQRIVIFLLEKENGMLDSLLNKMGALKENIKKCEICGNLDCGEICEICQDEKRDSSILCIVKDVSDLWAIERSRFFRGKYHVLGGELSAIDGIGPEQLNIKNLMKRLKNDNFDFEKIEGERKHIEEVILALSATLEGQTTSYFLAELFTDFNVNVSFLAQGVPFGGELNYLDEGTIAAAFIERKNIESKKNINKARQESKSIEEGKKQKSNFGKEKNIA